MDLKKMLRTYPERIFRYERAEGDKKWESLLKEMKVKKSHLGRYGYFDWKYYEKVSYCDYFLMEDTDKVKQAFRGSSLSKVEKLHLKYYFPYPLVLEMDTELFIEFYEEILCINGGPLGLVESEGLFFEAVKYYIYSNFNIFGEATRQKLFSRKGFNL